MMESDKSSVIEKRSFDMWKECSSLEKVLAGGREGGLGVELTIMTQMFNEI